MIESSSSTSSDVDLFAPTNQKDLPKRRARPWHRVLGLFAAVPLVWVVITGALLNHTVDWRLDQIMISHPWVLGVYGMTPKGEPRGLALAGHQVAEWDGLTFFDGKRVELTGRLLGGVASRDGLVVVTDSQVMRLDAAGHLIEVLDDASLPDLPLTGVHAGEGVIHLRNAEGWHRVLEGWLDFEKTASSFEPQTLEPLVDPARIEQLRVEWSEGGLPVSRVLLDLHAGHFLGSFSKYFYDLVAVATVWLCVTGLILFFRKPRRSR